MRWAGQEISNQAGDPSALPGLDRLHNLVRSVRTPEFAGITFHEVLAKSALNHVPKAAGLPFDWPVNPYRGCSHGCVCYPEVLGTGRGGRDGLSPAYNRYLSAFLSCAWRPAFERSDIAPARRQLARTFWSHRLSRPGCRLASAAIADTPLRKDASRLRPRAQRLPLPVRVLSRGTR
jgi:hypothetical protein